MTRKVLGSLVFILIFCSCSKEGVLSLKNQLVGNWIQIEILADPGNGSGVFRPVESNKTIEFFEDGIISSNGSLCDLTIEAENNSSGTYSIIDKTIIPIDCPDNPMKIRFDLDGSNLIISYPCIEGCMAKFIKE